MILGIDEVGRGPWAGPLVVGAVVLGGAQIEGLTDSKKLSKKRREQLDILIREHASGVGLGWVDAAEIDEIGLSSALVLATRRAVEQVTASYHEIIIDGTINFLKDTTKGRYVTTVKKADLLVPAVSAASIVAKVARDAYMIKQATIYPEYGFEDHVGYGTAAHIAAIDKLGVTPLHRLSFAPLAKYRTNDMDLSRTDPKATAALKITSLIREFSGAKGGSVRRQVQVVRTTKEIGDNGEDVAAQYLKKTGHTILDRNWKTKFCEIDIISQLDDTIYFTEVKYRRTSQQGGGIAAITPKKLRQMKFAVEFYALKNKISNTNLRLQAISATGQPPIIDSVLEVV
ncbi:ribonuclease HII [Patescibacteria group bacterium]|nr:MAG: ribonuclease HII [Patescibacteria group bacterium]